MITKKYYKLIRVSHEDSEYMRLKNVSNEAGIFKMVKNGSPAAPNLEYSLDGVTWTTYDFTTLPEVTVAAGSNIYFRGTNANQQFNRDSYSYVKFSFDKTCEGNGSICSLFDPDPAVFSTITSIGYAGLAGVFRDCNSLTKTPNLGNVTSIGNFGLISGFQGCSSLTTSPDFSNITSVGSNGLENCFTTCSSLTTSPDFSNITSVGFQGLRYCFNNCAKIGDVTTPNLSDLTANNVLDNWLSYAGTQATGTKTVRVPSGATIYTNSVSGIPNGWTRVDY